MKRSLLIALAGFGLFGSASAQLMPFAPIALACKPKAEVEKPKGEAQATSNSPISHKADFGFSLKGNTLTLVNHSTMPHVQAFWSVNWGEQSMFDKNAWTVSLEHDELHVITLILVDSAGRWLSDTYQNIYISDASASHRLVVASSIGKGPEAGILHLKPQVELLDKSRLDYYDSALPTYSYTVDYGDGAVESVDQSVAADFAHHYTCPGSYTVKIVAQGDNGHCYVSHEEVIHIEQVAKPLQADFSYRQVGQKLHLISLATQVAGETRWQLSDGRQFYGNSIWVDVPEAGPLSVTQTVYAGDCQAQHSQVIDIKINREALVADAESAPAASGSEIALPLFQVKPLYPNPAHQQVSVPVVGVPPNATITIEVSDLAGRKLLPTLHTSVDSNGEIVINTQDLAAGIVVLSISAPGQKPVSQKLCIQH